MENLYQYAVLLRPTDTEREDGAKTKVVVPPSGWILASSEQEVVLLAAKQIPSKMGTIILAECADRLEVVVRPF